MASGAEALPPLSGRALGPLAGLPRARLALLGPAAPRGGGTQRGSLPVALGGDALWAALSARAAPNAAAVRGQALGWERERAEPRRGGDRDGDGAWARAAPVPWVVAAPLEASATAGSRARASSPASPPEPSAAASASSAAPDASTAASSSRPQDGISMSNRFLAAAGASFISTIVVNPFDVAKTRIQEYAADPTRIKKVPGTWKTLRRVARREGIGALWRGTGVALSMAVPSVGLYFPLYDYLLAKCRDDVGMPGDSGPLVAGALARCFTTLLCTPVEIVRMRILSGHEAGTPAPSLDEQVQSAAEGAAKGGAGATSEAAKGSSGTAAPAKRFALARVTSSFRGLAATMARDIPFTLVYWGLVERIRAVTLAEVGQPSAAGAGANVRGGAGAGDGAARGGSAPVAAGHDHASVGAPAPLPASVWVCRTEDDAQRGAASSATATVSSAPSASHPTSAPLPQHSSVRVLVANATAGAIAGGVAGFFTTPLDVVKTRHQLAAPGVPQSTWGTLVEIAKSEGAKGLFAGGGARAAKVSPACAIVLACYEVIKIQSWE